MSRLICTGAFAVLLLAISGWRAQAIDLQPGQWEVSTKRERDGVVEERPKHTVCFTADNAKKITAQVSEATPPEQFKQFNSRGTSCKVADWKAARNEVTWHMQCTGLFAAEQTGRYVIESPQHYSSTLHSSVHSSIGANPRTLSSTLTTEAKRIGECPK